MHKFEIYGDGGKGRKCKGWKTTNSEHKLIVFSTASFAMQIICHKNVYNAAFRKTLAKKFTM